MNPDELANCKDMPDARGTIAAGLRKHGMQVSSIEDRVGALNEFWRSNDRVVNDPFEGIEPKDHELYKGIKKRSTRFIGENLTKLDEEGFGEE